MFRYFLWTAAVLLALAPVMARAQTNIDEGKSPAQIFANDCAACHKGPRGLANGKNSLMLSAFLREHYTASREQAAALAAYVLGAGGAERGSAAQGRGSKSGEERARTRSEEPKPPVRQTRRPAKPIEETPGAAKPTEAANPTEEPGTPGRRPATGHREPKPATVARGRRREKEEEPAQSHEPATVIAAPAAPAPAPAPAETLPQSAGPASTAAAPSEAEPAEGSAVPRDHIPD